MTDIYMELNTTNARAFNSSLKKAIKEITGLKASVEIINSYKFPHCWVRITPELPFSNDFRLRIFDACGNDRSSLTNIDDVSYGNIREGSISAYVSVWVKALQ